MLTPEVERAIDELRANFPGEDFAVAEAGDGGALVTTPELFLGHQYAPASASVSFHIGFQYPASDVYPHYLMVDLRRLDGRALGDGFSPVERNGVRAIQVSRRSNRWRPGVDSAAIKLHKVLEWIRER